jgi:hypothetical protein
MHSFMSSPLTTTLFAEHSDYRRPPASIAASLLIHVAACSLVSFGVLYTPPIDTRVALDRYDVRRLDLETPEERARRAAAEAIAYPGPRLPTHAPAAGGKQSAQSLVMPPVPQAKRGLQTLMQPDLRKAQTLAQETPVPQVVLWSPSKTPVVKIVAPLPAKPPTAAVKPTLQSPNPEVNLADIEISSATQPSLKQLIVPSTTTPIVVHGPPQPPTTPATVSQPSAKPTPAAVVSLSDLKMKNGTVTLPAVNEVAAVTPSTDLPMTPGPAKTSSASGSGSTAANAAAIGTGTGKSAGPHAGESPVNPANAPAAGGGSKFTIVGAGQAPAAVPSAGQGDQPTATAISLPKDGQFGAVIVGASLQDQYPEISDVWRGRMAYTVYLHVGLEKSWILQYSLPRAAEAEDAGTVARLDAPWPYSIVRPNLVPGSIDADALMIHGFVNIAGRFETLSVVFPAQFPQAQFILESLQHWQFRPASENGQIAKVEVLLIIPEEFE